MARSLGKILGINLGIKSQDNRLLLQDMFPDNAEWQINFRNANCYDGGENALSLVDAPASGANKSSYVFNNTNAPDLFEGEVGSILSKMVMTGDADQIFICPENTAFVESMHKTTGGRAFFCYVAGTQVDDAGGKSYIDTQYNSGGEGIAFNWSIDNTYRLQQHGDTGEVEVDSAESYSDGKVFLAGCSHDPVNNLTRICVNGVFTQIDHVFNATTTDASAILHLFGHIAAAFLPAGTEIYEAGCLSDVFITPEQEQILRENLNSCGDGRNYTDAGSLQPISFTDQANLDLEEVVESDIQIIRGFTGIKSVEVTGGEYKIFDIDGITVIQDWTSSEGVVSQLQNIKLRGETSSDPSTSINVVLEIDGEIVDIFTLTTAADMTTWTADVSTAVVDAGANFDPTQLTGAAGICFDVSGAKMYLVNNTDVVYQYTLSDSWNPSSAIYDSKSLSASPSTNSAGMNISEDGTKLYVACKNTSAIYQFTLSNPYDVSTGTYSGKSLDVSAEDSQPGGVWFSPDGTKIFISGQSNSLIASYDLSVPWDISTGVVIATFSVSGQDTTVGGVHLNPQGTSAYIVGAATDAVYQYTLSTPYDLTTAIYASKSFSIATQDTIPVDLFFKTDDGTKMFVSGASSQDVWRYSVTAS